MISYQEALSLLENIGHERARLSRPAVDLGIEDVVGRILVDPVLAPDDRPRWDLAETDGFALRSAGTRGASAQSPASLVVHGPLGFGTPAPGEDLPLNAAVEIPSGRPLPPPCNAVVNAESVVLADLEGSGRKNWIRLREPVPTGNGVFATGSDVTRGLVLFEPFTRLESQHIPLLASLGIARCRVLVHPRVALLSIGDELVNPSDDVMPGKIYNATANYLHAALSRLGCHVVWFGHFPDRPQEVTRALELLASQSFDLVVSTGSASTGVGDCLKEVLRRMDVEVLFSGVGMRPGRSAICSYLGRNPLASPLYVALPGTPLATVAAARFLVAPYLRAFDAQKPEEPTLVPLGVPIEKKTGQMRFLLANVVRNKDGARAFPQTEQNPQRLLPLARSSCWMLLPAEQSTLSTGDLVYTVPL